MKQPIGVLLIALAATGTDVPAQTMNHPWQVNDRGGGASTSGGVLLRSSIGQPAIQAAASGGLSLEGGYIPGIRLLGGAGTLEVHVEERWNLLSVPLEVDDFSRAALYPAAVSEAFVYAGGYRPEDTLRVGIGFWLKFDSSVTVPFSGSVVAVETVDVQDKWNIIGSLSHPVAASNIVPIPPSSITSNYYGYSGTSGYFVADTLQPGHGYWVKVDSAGKIAISVSPSIPAAASDAGPAPSRSAKAEEAAKNSITVRDALGRERTVWFVASPAGIDPRKWLLPPLPPSGVMDVRYSTDAVIETADPAGRKEVGVRISSASYPLTITWKVDDRNDGALLIADRREIAIRGTGTATIPEQPLDLRLRLSPSSGDRVPSEFALAQNYPNPFNPSTTIRFDVPVAGLVTLVVYDILGREVTVLANEVMEPGFRTLEWDAGGQSGGVYFLKMTAGSFSSVKKMLLMR